MKIKSKMFKFIIIVRDLFVFFCQCG